ncbi:helix-turn-helix domain-containing protein [Corticicoccus populi]|uniref:Helix-turn-helix domain-containing protein n=1 Tax=Corticicoccus populi TaxID=1812821 RepID=A0ABW5WYN7_9STAP
MEAKEFGAFLRKKRKEKKMTIEELRTVLGVSQPYISNLENGKKGIPKPDTLRKFSKALDISYVELMTEAGYTDDDGSVPISSFADMFPPSQHENEKQGYMTASDSKGNIEFTKAVGSGGVVDYSKYNYLDIYEILSKTENVMYKRNELDKDDKELLISLLDRTFIKGD